MSVSCVRELMSEIVLVTATLVGFVQRTDAALDAILDCFLSLAAFLLSFSNLLSKFSPEALEVYFLSLG